MLNKNVLILGVTGQDGSYLSKLLIDKGYSVFGTTRNSFNADISNLQKLGIAEKVNLISSSLKDLKNLISILEEINPAKIFHLAGQTSVGLSFELPIEAIESITLSTLNILEAVKNFNPKIKLFIPCSSECFGNTNYNNPADENYPFKPCSPYAIAKSSVYWLANYYRKSHGIFVTICFLSNHESPLRGENFVTSKIVKGIKGIIENNDKKIQLGNIDIVRDWGWAPSYVEAIYKAINIEYPDDFFISTGKSHSLRELISIAFKLSNLGDYNQYIETNNNEIRPIEIRESFLDPSKAKRVLNWENSLSIEQIIFNLINNKLY